MNIKDFFRGRIRRIGIVPVSLAVIIFSVAVIVAIVFVIKDAPQPLEVAVAVLTLLIAIIAIYMGLSTWMSKRDWEAFEKRQAPIIKETSEELEKLKKETEEIDWLDKLRKSMEEDPLLHTQNALGTIQDIKEHYFGRDKYNEAWEYYGVARWFDEKEQYDRAIKYYKEADDVDLEEDNSKDKELRKHICQSLGKNYFQHGLQLEAKGKNADAIKDYEAAIECYDKVIKYDPQFAMAHFNKASTLIQLGKIEGDKTEPYNDANYCYKEAIASLEIIEDNYGHFYDKARAHALLDQRDEAIESLRHSFTLAERDLGKLFRYLERDKEDFKNVEEEEEFKALVKRY